MRPGGGRRPAGRPAGRRGRGAGRRPAPVTIVGSQAVTPQRGRAAAISHSRSGSSIRSMPTAPLHCRSTKPGATGSPPASRTGAPDAGGPMRPPATLRPPTDPPRTDRSMLRSLTRGRRPGRGCAAALQVASGQDGGAQGARGHSLGDQRHPVGQVEGGQHRRVAGPRAAARRGRRRAGPCPPRPRRRRARPPRGRRSGPAAPPRRPGVRPPRRAAPSRPRGRRRRPPRAATRRAADLAVGRRPAARRWRRPRRPPRGSRAARTRTAGRRGRRAGGRSRPRRRGRPGGCRPSSSSPAASPVPTLR